MYLCCIFLHCPLKLELSFVVTLIETANNLWRNLIIYIYINRKNIFRDLLDFLTYLLFIYSFIFCRTRILRCLYIDMYVCICLSNHSETFHAFKELFRSILGSDVPSVVFSCLKQSQAYPDSSGHEADLHLFMILVLKNLWEMFWNCLIVTEVYLPNKFLTVQDCWRPAFTSSRNLYLG